MAAWQKNGSQQASSPITTTPTFASYCMSSPTLTILRSDLSGVCVFHAAVDVEDVAGAPRRTGLGGEVEHGLGNVLGQHVYLQDVAPAVVIFELVRLDTVRGGALLALA